MAVTLVREHGCHTQLLRNQMIYLAKFGEYFLSGLKEEQFQIKLGQTGEI